MNEDQKRYLADKVGDLANLAAAGLIFGQLVSGKEVVKPWLILGFIGVVCFYAAGTILMKARQRKE